MVKINYKSLYLTILVAFFGIISFFIIRKFIVPLLFTGILVYLFNPMYQKLLKIFRSSLVTSVLMILMILTMIIAPMSLTIWEVSKEVQYLKESNIADQLDQLSTTLNKQYDATFNLRETYDDFLVTINNYIKDAIYNLLPSFIFNIIIISFFFYYFLKNYSEENKYYEILVDKVKFNEISHKVKSLINGVIYGQILVRLIQALTGTLLFLLVGVKGALIWGVLLFFASFIPMLGTFLIWGPLALVTFIEGDINLSLVIVLIGLFISVIDNFLFPVVIAERTNIGPVTTLISILGGLELFGIYGLILGPFFLGLFFVFLEELLIKIKEENPKIKRYLWSRDERERYRNLRTDIARREFIRMLQRKYEKEEKEGKEVHYRYEGED